MADPSNRPQEHGAADPDAAAIGQLIFAAYRHNLDLIRDALREGVTIDSIDPLTGLAALHIAVGNNDLALCRFLIEECGAGFFPDRFGRWPTVVAAECRVDDELSDYIVSQESRALMRS